MSLVFVVALCPLLTSLSSLPLTLNHTQTHSTPPSSVVFLLPFSLPSGRDFIEDYFRLLLSPAHLTAFPGDHPVSTGKIDTLPVLPPSMSLPESYKGAYQALSPLVREWWTPSPTVEMQVQLLKEEWRLEERESVGCHVSKPVAGSG